MLELYHHGSSVCAAKVRFALAEKGKSREAGRVHAGIAKIAKPTGSKL